MSKIESQRNGKKTAIALLVLAVAVILLAGIYFVFAPKAMEGGKDIVIEVVDDKQDTVTYEIRTDAEYLREAMEEAGIEFSGTESDYYGLMIETVNGLYADYVGDGAYWAIYVDGEYGNYGVDAQPVEDGKTYRIVYTIME